MGCLKLSFRETGERQNFLSVWRRGTPKKIDHRNFLPLGEKKDGKENCIDYYPFGLTFNSYSGENTTPQNLKYQSWEIQDELDLNIYSTEFRTYEPSLGRWMQIDPKANEFHSPYVGMGNNPLRYIDPKGDTIIVLNAQNAVAGAGHAAVLVGNDKDGYKLYSKNGTASSRSSSNDGEGVTSSSGESTDDDEGVPFKSLEEFANSSFNKDEGGNQYYTRGYMIPTDGATDQKAMEGAQSQLDKDYNVVSANCVDVCSDGLKNAGLNPGYERVSISGGTGAPGVVDNKYLSPIPNRRYDNIVKNNPGGTDVTSRIKPKK